MTLMGRPLGNPYSEDEAQMRMENQAMANQKAFRGEVDAPMSLKRELDLALKTTAGIQEALQALGNILVPYMHPETPTTGQSSGAQPVEPMSPLAETVCDHRHQLDGIHQFINQLIHRIER